MSREWRMFLGDMREACDRILAYSDELGRDTFDHHGIAYDAIVRNIELPGEAARHVPAEVRGRCAEIEWTKIVALRNILVHGYFGIDDDILWDVVQNRVPQLRSAIQELEDSIR
ncbi:MAG: HepT-like ribonuclease domain-containing protein [Gammaproteobacteria bacterium]